MMEIGKITKTLDDEGRVNAWMFFEVQMIGMAAGWWEGMSATSKGMPRPPVCHYK